MRDIAMESLQSFDNVESPNYSDLCNASMDHFDDAFESISSSLRTPTLDEPEIESSVLQGSRHESQLDADGSITSSLGTLTLDEPEIESSVIQDFRHESQLL